MVHCWNGLEKQQMIVFQVNKDHSDQSSLVLLFGLGLIGQSIAYSLMRFENTSHRIMPYNWSDPTLRSIQRVEIRKMLRAYRSKNVERIAFVWAAGRSGFGSDGESLDRELKLLGEAIEVINDAREVFIDARPSVHLMSSAGGLFEGLTHCDSRTKPQPLRPYGVGKLEQEAYVLGLDEGIVKRIYRPSSVYGFSNGGRLGLISTLVKNALTNESTRIFGHCNTLRDYVLANDIGRFVTHQVLRADVGGETVCLLARGRSASMYEVIETVRRILQKDLILQFDPKPHNALDIGFMPSALPKSWNPTDLVEGIGHVITKLRRNWAEAA